MDGIVLPGGESTAISLIGEKNGIFEAIKKWVNCGNPVWGTCAGCIMLSKDVHGQKLGGYELSFPPLLSLSFTSCLPSFFSSPPSSLLLKAVIVLTLSKTGIDRRNGYISAQELLWKTDLKF